MYLRSKHQVQTRYFDRISTLNSTLFRLTGETILLGILACFSSAFLAVRRLQTDGQSGLVQNIGHAALLVGLFQSAEVGVFLGERRQSVPQSGIVGLDVCCVLALVEPKAYRASISLRFIFIVFSSLNVGKNKSDRDFTRKYLSLCLRYEIVGSGLMKFGLFFRLKLWMLIDFLHQQNAHDHVKYIV